MLFADGRYTIGWLGRPEKKGGPVFVTVRQGMFDGRKIVERYPMTDDGWSRAWQAFVRLDPATAEKVQAVLARRAERDRHRAARRELEARSLSCLQKAVFIGGHVTGTELAAGQPYELRFLADRLSVFAPDGVDALAEFPYTAVETVEVDGPAAWADGRPGSRP